MFHPSSIIFSPSWDIVLFAFLLDLALGDPRWLPHPVVLIGRFITFLEYLLRRFAKGVRAELAAGGFTALLVPATAFVVAWFLIKVAAATDSRLGWATAVILGYTTIAARSLFEEPMKVAAFLKNGDITGARKGLSFLVGRDTHTLDEREISRALVETVAENTSDGVVAPLFYLAIGGPPLAMAYKAINTLDSMVGYKNERYLHFGRVSARLDDAANYIPARLTAVLLVMAAFVLGKNWKGAIRIAVRDGRNHPSPNSGYPEAAVAGALGRRLGGLSHYDGKPSEKPFIGDDNGNHAPGDVKDAALLMISASLLMTSFMILILLLLR